MLIKFMRNLNNKFLLTNFSTSLAKKNFHCMIVLYTWLEKEYYYVKKM